MSLYLSDSSTEKAILLQLHHALAEVHFKLNEHQGSIDSGEECFKLQPIKSEVNCLIIYSDYLNNGYEEYNNSTKGDDEEEGMILVITSCN